MRTERRTILDNENPTKKKTVKVFYDENHKGETDFNDCEFVFPDDFLDDEYLDFDPSIFDEPVADDENKWWW